MSSFAVSVIDYLHGMAGDVNFPGIFTGAPAKIPDGREVSFQECLQAHQIRYEDIFVRGLQMSGGYLFISASAITGGTKGRISPFQRRISRTREELVSAWDADVWKNTVSSSGIILRFVCAICAS